MDGWPFVGRDAELARGAELLAGGVGVLLLGEAGIGKTALRRRLADAAAGRDAAAGPGAVVVSLSGRALSGGTPFEAFAEVVPAARIDTARTDPVRPSVAGVARAVRALAGARPLVVAVDDVDLLDDDSARVLLHLAEQGARVLATARGPQLGEVADALWREGRCERWELGGLGGTEVAELLETTFDGPVEPSAVAAFCRRSGGNPLLLRELVNAARRDGGIVRVAGAWRLEGPPVLGGGLHEMFAARLRGLGDGDRHALDLLAAGEPLPLAVATALIGDDALGRLDQRRLIAVESGLDGATVSTGHPLYGEVLRAELSQLRLRRLRLTLAQTFEQSPAPRPYEIVRAAVWRMDDGQPDDPQRLLAAARAARSISLDTAERLARRAHDAQSSLPATLLLAEILTHTGRADEASRLVAGLPSAALAAEDREMLVYCAAIGGGLLVGDSGGGADMVAALIGSGDGASVRLRALHASLLAFDGRLGEAIAAAGTIVGDESAPPDARALAALGVVGAACWQGRFAQTVALAETLAPVADDPQARQALPFAGPSLALLVIDALTLRGDLDAAQLRAASLAELAGTRDDPFSRARAEYSLGRLALLRGRAGEALHRFRRCLAALTPFDGFMARHLQAMVAHACAALGRLHEASAALADADEGPRVTVYEPDALLAIAAVEAAQLRMAQAAERAAWAAGLAADRGLWSVALRACHDAARYGAARAVLADARTAAAHTDGALPALLLAHVEALATDAAEALERVAERFAAVGATASAAEAAAEAALSFAEHDRRSATRCAVRARELAAQTDVVTPWLTGAATAVPLTPRERQVAALAGTGLADAAIAARLGISIRTVQTHLAHVYVKLGVTRRTELAARLAS